MGRWFRIWLVCFGLWAGICVLVATLLVLGLRDFELCVPEWGGCDGEDEAAAFGWGLAIQAVLAFSLFGLVPGALVIAVVVVLAALAAGVARDYRRAAQRKSEDLESR